MLYQMFNKNLLKSITDNLKIENPDKNDLWIETEMKKILKAETIFSEKNRTKKKEN